MKVKAENVSLISIAVLTLLGAAIIIMLAWATQQSTQASSIETEMHEWCIMNPKAEPIEICHLMAVKMGDDPSKCGKINNTDLSFLKQACMEN